MNKKITLSTMINASPKKVWETVIGEETYKEWTSVWNPESHIKGSWEPGEKIWFLAPNEMGGLEGMVAVIAENIPYQFISIKHIGFVENDQEYTEGPEVESWTPAYENYTLKEIDGKTEFILDMDSSEQDYDYFMKTWPKALEKLKEICERNS